jgi:23S rRNA pseudouridine2605 synthase
LSEERLQKILARAGVASRRHAEELIREGVVTINGSTAAIGDKADPERDSIKVEGRRIQLPERHRYLLLNKPKGVMSTVSDPEGRTTVLDLVPPAFRRALVPVGRLDFNTEGLILLTDDGDFAQRVAHPRYGSVKVYEVKVNGHPHEAELNKLRTGIVLEGRRTAPCRITPLGAHALAARGVRRRPARPAGAGGAGRKGRREAEETGEGNSWWSVELSEGRTRQIREMFFRIGHAVEKLRRVAIGPLRDPRLPVGAVRELTEREVALLLRPPARTARHAPAAEGAAPRGRAAEPARAKPMAARGPARSAAPSAARAGSKGKRARQPVRGTAPAAGATRRGARPSSAKRSTPAEGGRSPRGPRRPGGRTGR